MVYYVTIDKTRPHEAGWLLEGSGFAKGIDRLKEPYLVKPYGKLARVSELLLARVSELLSRKAKTGPIIGQHVERRPLYQKAASVAPPVQ